MTLKLSYTALLISSLFILSCARVKPYPDIGISTDKRVIEVLQSKAEGIKTINATLSIKPAALRAAALDAHMSYEREGMFRLTGFTPTGFTLFNLDIQDEQFTLLYNRGEISGNIKEFTEGFKGIFGMELSPNIGIVREAIDFYGSDGYPDAVFFIEEFEDYYILNQLRGERGISYPVRRWWTEKGGMRIVRKEVFSDLPEKRGERLFEALYGDFRTVDDIQTPFEIVINGEKGKRLMTMKLKKVEYNNR